MLTSVLCYEGVWEIGDITPHILTSVLLGGEWSDSCPSHLTYGGRTPLPSKQEASWGPELV